MPKRLEKLIEKGDQQVNGQEKIRIKEEKE